MPTVSNAGATIHYESDGEGPALVFAHGSGGNGASWWQQVPHFSRSHRVITFDHRSFGRSRCEDADFKAELFASDVAAVLDTCGVERAALVGQSMGGWSVLPFALAHPERVTALILACTPGGIFTREVAIAAAQSVGQGLDDEFLKGGITFAPDFAARDPERAWLYDQLSSLNTEFSPELLGAIFAEPARIAPEALTGFSVPTLALIGEHDALFPPAALHTAVDQIPGVETLEVAGAGHSIYWEMPDTFNRIVADFVAKHAQD